MSSVASCCDTARDNAAPEDMSARVAAELELILTLALVPTLILPLP